MQQTIGAFLEMISADDCYLVNIRRGKERLYWGYENEVTEDIKALEIKEVYIDWASEALGISV